MFFFPSVLKNWSGVSVNLHVWNENSGDMKAIVDYQKPRTRQSVTVWHLPDSVLVHILQGFHIKDIFNFQCVSKFSLITLQLNLQLTRMKGKNMKNTVILFQNN